MKRLLYSALVCLLYFLVPVAHAETNWSFIIETPNVVIRPTDSFSVLGSITNLATSTSALSIHELCPQCLISVAMLVGAADSTPFDLFSVDTSPINATLPGLHLNPGESFSFTAYTVSPLIGVVPTGSYEFIINDLFIPEYGFSSGGPVHIAVVPEPSRTILMLVGMGLLGVTLRARKTGA